MTMRYRKSIAVAGAVALSLLVVAPSNAVGEATATIHVVSKVVNDNSGAKLPSDFTFQTSKESIEDFAAMNPLA